MAPTRRARLQLVQNERSLAKTRELSADLRRARRPAPARSGSTPTSGCRSRTPRRPSRRRGQPSRSSSTSARTASARPPTGWSGWRPAGRGRAPDARAASPGGPPARRRRAAARPDRAREVSQPAGRGVRVL